MLSGRKVLSHDDYFAIIDLTIGRWLAEFVPVDAEFVPVDAEFVPVDAEFVPVDAVTAINLIY